MIHRQCMAPSSLWMIFLVLYFILTTVMNRSVSSSISMFSVTAVAATVVVGLTEEERLVEYESRNYQWPVEHFIPDTIGWNELCTRRFQQVSELDTMQDRWEGYAQLMSSCVLQPNFTHYGFAISRAPDELMNALRQGIYDGLSNGKIPSEEYRIPVIEGPLTPWFINRPDLTKRVLNELQQYPEGWVGMELIPSMAYGFRLYRNESYLNMHVDKTDTHVISFILHIASSEDSKPWPILIEDFKGNSHEVVLTSGDVLLYESSKVFHGRPQKFIGSWYTSVFVHYYPKYGWKDKDDTTMMNRHQEKIYSIPPNWKDDPPTTTKNETKIPIQMVGTSFKEPTCPNQWCATQHAISWNHGPGQFGYFIEPTGERFALDLMKDRTCVDQDPQCITWVTTSHNDDDDEHDYSSRNVCEDNALFLMVKCPKSCGVCGDDDDDDDEEEYDEDDYYYDEDYEDVEEGEEEDYEEEEEEDGNEEL